MSYGVSVTCDDDWWRVERLLEVSEATGVLTTLISFEPLLWRIAHEVPREIEWVIVGAQTGVGAVAPEAAWVRNIWLDALPWTPVFEKNNLADVMPHKLPFQRWPEAMVRETTGRARRPSPAGRCAAHSAPPPVGRCAPEGGRGAKVTARDDNGVGLEARPTRRDDADRGE